VLGVKSCQNCSVKLCLPVRRRERPHRAIEGLVVSGTSTVWRGILSRCGKVFSEVFSKQLLFWAAAGFQPGPRRSLPRLAEGPPCEHRRVLKPKRVWGAERGPAGAPTHPKHQ
jgi:hypothetical protein